MIKVHSILNEGSKFELYFDLKKVNKPQETVKTKNIEQKENNFSLFKILVVEDNPNNRKIMQLMLEKIGIQPVFQFNGLDAIEHIKAGYKYDLIFMDLMMPKMDGIGATMEIRKFEKENQLDPMKIIAVTASSYDNDKQKFLESGMNGFISKPI